MTVTGNDAPPTSTVDTPVAVFAEPPILAEAPPVPAPAQPVPAPAPPVPEAPALPGQPSRPGSLVIERILRDREGLWRDIVSEQGLNRLIRQMLISSVVSLALYGLVLGASGHFLQVFSSAVKLPLLFLLTLGICLPTLYLFNLVLGARLSIRQALALVLVAITVIGALTLAFAPISLFFLVTAHDYSFFKLLNVGILMLTGFVGLSVMVDGMRGMNRLSGHEPAAPIRRTPDAWPNHSYPVAPGFYAALPPQGLPHGGPPAPIPAPVPAPAPAPRPAADGDRPVNTRLLYVWVLLFGFVGTQLAWTLRPFIGEPNHPFQLFRGIDGSFYGNVLHTLAHLF